MPPGYQPPPQSFSDIPPSAPGYGMPPGSSIPGYVPPTGYTTAQPGITVISQFSGYAMWSIILGIVSVGVPVVTGIVFGGTTYYFYILPIFGFVRGVQAVMRGQVIGGVVGIVLNIIGGLLSFFIATQR
jgi:hypothetical protein